MAKRETLTASQVLRRMRAGDLPTYGGGYSVGGHFDDGAKAAAGVMRRLERQRKIDYPAASSVYARWTLATPEESRS